MPEPPDVSLFTRYVLENPWPVGLALLAAAAWLLWAGMREGQLKKLQGAAGVGLAGAAVLLTGYLVVTSGERAKAVTRELVDAAVAEDAIAAVAMFTDEAAFAVGSPRNPGLGIDYIRDQLIRLTERYPIESNTITMLKGFSETSDMATTHMACFTNVNGFTNVSQWVVRVKRQPDGEWKVIHLTCVTVNGQTPQLGGLR
jgi:ketosteroid isomerase-like protein